MFFQKNILQCVPKDSGSWKYNMYFPIAEVARKTPDMRTVGGGSSLLFLPVMKEGVVSCA